MILREKLEILKRNEVPVTYPDCRRPYYIQEIGEDFITLIPKPSGHSDEYAFGKLVHFSSIHTLEFLKRHLDAA